MALSKEHIKEAKFQLRQQVENLPKEQKADALKQIEIMSDEAIESLVTQQRSQNSQQKIFRMIVSEEIPAVKIKENSEAVAVLSKMAVSEGHTLIIPKSPAETEKDIPKLAYTLADEISNKIASNLKPKSIEVFPETNFGENILNVIPVYGSPLSLKSQRTDKSPEQLESIKKKILTIRIEKPEKEKIKIKSKSNKSSVIKLNRRVP